MFYVYPGKGPGTFPGTACGTDDRNITCTDKRLFAFLCCRNIIQFSSAMAEISPDIDDSINKEYWSNILGSQFIQKYHKQKHIPDDPEDEVIHVLSVISKKSKGYKSFGRNALLNDLSLSDPNLTEYRLKKC